MSSISRILVVLALSLGLSVSSPVEAKSIFDLMSSDFDFKFPFLQIEELHMPQLQTDTSGDTVTVKIEVPGIEASNLNVTVTEDELYIKGERKEETEKKKRYNTFQKTITFPCRINSEKAEAKLKNGILTITAPKGPDNGRRGKLLTIQTE